MLWRHSRIGLPARCSGRVGQQRPDAARTPPAHVLVVVLATVLVQGLITGERLLCPAHAGVGGAVQRVSKNAVNQRYTSPTNFARYGDRTAAPVVPGRSLEFQINDSSSSRSVDFQVVTASWDTYVDNEAVLVNRPQWNDSATYQNKSGGCRQCLPDLITVDPQLSPYQQTGPWPGDEYICDGGDYSQRVRVRADWSVDGLDMEDTVAHFDTLDGRTIVKPTDRVCIYAPRFAAVRQISGASEHKQQEHMNEILVPLQPQWSEEVQTASTTLQQAQPVIQLGKQPANIFRERQVLESFDRPQKIGTLSEENLAQENFSLIRYGIFDETERLLLTEFSDAAQSWSHDAAVQVVIEETQAIADVLYQKPQTLYKLDPQGKPELCVTKMASRKSALPGDVIDFTLRFDNVGNEQIGNVTLIDNLSPRLEYVSESAQCSLDTEFFTRENEGESLILRWEIKQPLEPGKGGLIRFRCKVR